MATYDTEIRVGTKVDANELQKAQKEFDRLEKKLESLYAKGDKLESLGVNKQSMQWKSLQYDVAQTEIALEDATERLKELNAIKSTSDGFKEAEEAARGFHRTLQKENRKSNGLLKTMGSRLKGIALSLLVFNWISKGFNAMVASMKEGFRNLAQYSNEYNGAMSAMKSSAAQLKNSLATAFEPIVTMAIPYITRLINWLNKALDTIAQFTAALSGRSTYNRAKQQMIDYAKSIDTATKSAKRALAPFDELNVIARQQDSSKAGGGGELTGADAFETVKIDDGIIAAAEKVREVLEKIKPIAEAIGIALAAWEIGKIIGNLFEMHPKIKDILAIIDMIAESAEAVKDYLEMWENGVNWESLIDYIKRVAKVAAVAALAFGLPAAAIAILIFSIAALILAIKDMCENGFTAENVTMSVIGAIGTLIGVFLLFGAAAATVVGVIMLVVGAFWAIFYATGNAEEILYSTKKEFSAFGDFLKNVFAGDWDAAFKSIKKSLIYSANSATAQLESIVNFAIKQINKLIDLINKIFGSEIGHIRELELTRLPKAYTTDTRKGQSNSNRMHGSTLTKVQSSGTKYKIPKLADGAVIQGGRPFAAILGDQRLGQTNIETPPDTMVSAFKQAMAEFGGGGSYTFTANINGREMFREIVRQNQMHKKSTGGKSAFV